eukprot:9743292-Karenia_brevis.AAC.1
MPLDAEVQRCFGGKKRLRFQKETDEDEDIDGVSESDTSIDIHGDANFCSLSSSELEGRLEAVYKEHSAALAAREWSTAQTLLASIQRLTEALQSVTA